MTTERDHLDEAIDHVARRLVRVEDDSRLAAQIAASLPERRHWLVGLTWRLAAIVLLAGASVIVLQRSNGGSTEVLRTGEQVLSSSNVAPFANLALGVAPHPALRTEIVRSTFVEPPSDLRRTASDHERALASLALVPLADEPVLEDGFLSVDPLSIDDLPLASELLSLPE